MGRLRANIEIGGDAGEGEYNFAHDDFTVESSCVTSCNAFFLMFESAVVVFMLTTATYAHDVHATGCCHDCRVKDSSLCQD